MASDDQQRSTGGAMPRLKRGVRSLADRAAVPYMNKLTNRLTERMQVELAPVREMAQQSLAAVQEIDRRPSGAPDVLDRLLPGYYPLLHELRSTELAAMPPGVSTILSAGCNGRWYFDWFDDCYGVVERHIGIERYVAPPDDLPPNVEWIDDDTADMSRVDDGVVDLVFSGQNIEHLWPEQVVGFLLEAHRVLRPGGWIVLDSPNREITDALNWSHPEHIVEFTVDEADRILTLAGFTKESMRGIWINRIGGRVLPLYPLDEGSRTDSIGILSRIVHAARRPEDSFVWWAEYRKEGTPDVEGLRKLLDSIYEDNWPTHVDRLVPHLPVETDSDGRWVKAGSGVTTLLFDGPFLPLPPGRHVATLTFRIHGTVTRPAVTVEVTKDHNLQERISLTEVSGTGETGLVTVEIPIEVDEVTFGIQFRARTTGASAVDALLHIDLASS